MPKKPVKTKTDKKVLDELAESLKKKLMEDMDNSFGDKSDLEDDVQLNESSFGNGNFNQFLDSGTPVLERIAGSGPRPIFVGGIPQSQAATGGNENNGKDNFKYMAGDNAAGEAKYIESEHMTATTERVDFSRVGRQTSNPWENINQQAMFVNSPEARAESLAQERLFGVERFDSEKERKKDFRERDETKYDKYKPDLPKSR